MVEKVGRTIHHAEDLHQALHLVQAAQLIPESGEDSQADLACGDLALLECEIGADTPGDQGFVGF